VYSHHYARPVYSGHSHYRPSHFSVGVGYGRGGHHSGGGFSIRYRN